MLRIPATLAVSIVAMASGCAPAPAPAPDATADASPPDPAVCAEACARVFGPQDRCSAACPTAATAGQSCGACPVSFRAGATDCCCCAVA